MIEAVLGHGGMGVVYKARQTALKRHVALKMVLSGVHASPRELARFRTEAEAVARLQHPNIVQIHDVGHADGHPYCALEYVDGDTLARRLDAQALAARPAAEMVATLAHAIDSAHRQQVVHRDLKPANILLTREGVPKVTDFGLARRLDTSSGDTQSGVVMGTPAYMAPEQAAGRAHEAGPAVDIDALGAILYEALTGKPPFHGATIVETLDRVRHQDPVAPRRLQPTIPRDLEIICFKALAKDPAGRYRTAADFADDLHRFLNDEPIQARPVPWTERLWRRARRNPALVGLTAAVAMLAILVVVILSKGRSAEVAIPEKPLAAPTADTSADDLRKAVAALDRSEPD